ncbi:vesicle-fusing atpase [Anaeramoeba ignava]|uniref:Vesicle-fusing ATPase n=1 Tax=Anaeramoeba ignava TaxID=1746090 RepID=A0A9Q0R7Z0_ANAIG|nr:vesicle-fusing atpase [Anaeramoeba ignava]
MFLKPTNSPDTEHTLTNKVFVSQDDYYQIISDQNKEPHHYAMINGHFIYNISPSPKISKGQVALSNIQRMTCSIGYSDMVELKQFFIPEEDFYISDLTLEMGLAVKNPVAKKTKIDSGKLCEKIIRTLNNQVLTLKQKFIIDYEVLFLKCLVKDVKVVSLSEMMGESSEISEISVKEDKDNPQFRGLLTSQTQIFFEKTGESEITISGQSNRTRTSIFRPDWNFESMGIGGLDKEFSDIFRRAFASRVFPPSVIRKLGVSHVRGILLWGPPGTGKTLMARQIGKMLNGKEPKVVNGPEILNKYVGQSEENIRKLFEDAEKEQLERGDESDLHIIIFDEIDAICRKRGTRNDGTGVGDTVVNQLLAKIDGVDSLNNILVIGMTNRKDMIDEALLRPGRLEVQMEINLPNEYGRIQIFRIHTSKMQKEKMLAKDVNLEELAKLTKNFSGAEIEGLVKSATSFALNRRIDPDNLSKPVSLEGIQVTRDDFLTALREVKPAFGVEEDQFEPCLRNGIINYGSRFDKLYEIGMSYLQQVSVSERTPLISVLVKGAAGTGKTAFAAKLSMDSKFPFVKMISADSMIGMSEIGKCNQIGKVFDDAYRSPFSIIVIDDIERIFDFVPIGPRFSNSVLQTLLVMLKKIPPVNRKLLVFATTSSPDVLQEVGFESVFSAHITVPQLVGFNEISSVLLKLNVFNDKELKDNFSRLDDKTIGIKQLIMVIEMYQQIKKKKGSNFDSFLQCWEDFILK